MKAPRRTSLEAFDKIREDGLLSKTRLAVYDLLYFEGPLTGHEVDARLSNGSNRNPCYHQRLSELRDRGVAMEVGERQCSITGHKAIIWDVTEFLPQKPEKLKASSAGRLLSRREKDNLRQLLDHWERLAILRGETIPGELEKLKNHLTGD